MEMIDVLDENGVKTGKTTPRKEVHKKGLWHRAILVAIINENNEILLQQRSKNKEKNANMWDLSVAGHVSSGQDSLTSAMREIKEELGICLNTDISLQDFRYMFSYRESKLYTENFIENQFYDFFILRQPYLNIENINMQISEVQSVKLVTVSNLLQMQKDKLLVDRKPVYDMLFDYLNNTNPSKNL